MSEFDLPKIIKDNIRIGFYDVINVSKALIHIIKGSHLPDIGITNIKYILTPRASRIIPHFRMALYPLPPYNSGRILNADDFRNFDLIEVPKAWLRVFSRMKELYKIELNTLECNSIIYVSSVNQDYVYTLPKLYDELVSETPYEFTTALDPNYDYISLRANRAINTATTILTLLYNICEFADKIKFVKWPYEESYDADADRYGKELIEIIREFGNNFEEAFKALVSVGSFF